MSDIPHRPCESEYPPLAAKYVALVPDQPLANTLSAQLMEVGAVLEALTEAQGDYRYAGTRSPRLAQPISSPVIQCTT